MKRLFPLLFSVALCLCGSDGLADSRTFVTVGDCCPGAKPAENLTVDGYFIPIAREHMVINVGGNCGFCSVEICARYLGLKELHGFSKGKHGTNSSDMARWLDRYGVRYKQATSRSASLELMRECLADGRPVLFSIPGHALVCCGWTKSAAGGEYLWVVDNTGREGATIKGWPKAEFDRRFSGWVCGLFPIFPGNRPWHKPPDAPKPGPHVDPTPDMLTSPLAKQLAELDARLKGLEGKTTAVEKKQDEHVGLLDRLKEKQPEILAALGTLKDQMGGVGGLLQKGADLGPLVDKLKADGLITADKADKAHAILEKLAAVAPKVKDLEEKVGPVVSAIPWGAILGGIGSGGSLLAILMGLLGAFGKAKSGGGDLSTILGAIAGIKDAIHAKSPIVVAAPPATGPAPATP